MATGVPFLPRGARRTAPLKLLSRAHFLTHKNDNGIKLNFRKFSVAVTEGKKCILQRVKKLFEPEIFVKFQIFNFFQKSLKFSVEKVNL